MQDQMPEAESFEGNKMPTYCPEGFTFPCCIPWGQLVKHSHKEAKEKILPEGTGPSVCHSQPHVPWWSSEMKVGCARKEERSNAGAQESFCGWRRSEKALGSWKLGKGMWQKVKSGAEKEGQEAEDSLGPTKEGPNVQWETLSFFVNLGNGSPREWSLKMSPRQIWV